MQVSRLPLLSGLGEEYERVPAGSHTDSSSGPTVISVGRIGPMELDSRSVQVIGRPQGPSLYEEPPGEVIPTYYLCDALFGSCCK